MLGARWATLLSAALAMPLLLLLILVRLDYEPPFLPLLTNPDGTPTTLGRALMLGILLERSDRTGDQPDPPPSPASRQIGPIRPDVSTCHRRTSDAQRRHAHHSPAGIE